MTIRYRTEDGVIHEIEGHLSTGVFDKNGVEIFEGDKVKHYDGRVVTVKYDSDNWAFDMEFSRTVLDQECCCDLSIVEVVA